MFYSPGSGYVSTNHRLIPNKILGIFIKMAILKKFFEIPKLNMNQIKPNLLEACPLQEILLTRIIQEIQYYEVEMNLSRLKHF